MAAAAADDSAIPNWVMLERFVFRRDDPKSFREDKRTFASGTTPAGTQFDVSFILAEPPTPSRLYLSWPEGPKQEDRRLPHCTEYNAFFEMPVTRAFQPLAVGLLCHGEDEFAVAHLAITRSRITSDMQAELCVLRSSLSCSDDAKWETKILPMQYQDDEYSDFLYWVVNGVVPFKNALCFVDYSRGILFCDSVFEDSPKIMPMHARGCTTACVSGRRLVFVDVARHDGKGLGPMMPNTGFTLTSRTLKMTGNCTTQWEWIDDAVVTTSGQLWHANTIESLPHDIVMLPLLSMDKANAAHLVLFDWDDGRVSLVSIDLSNKQVMGSVVTYIKGKDDTADADMIKAKPGFFAHFIPSEFPKFLDLSRWGTNYMANRD
uniref:DUF1618 domain-containing protein n=1 Tax=Setaria italica TaxID=4555 RepID=K4A1X8_SETIT